MTILFTRDAALCTDGTRHARQRAAPQRSLADEPARRRRHDYVVAAADHMERHASETLSLARVARSVSLSPHHFLRVFREVMGVTPHQYLLRIRLQRALTLLRETSLPITTIGHEAGWTDLSSFLRVFRREIGCSPRQFRRRRLEPRQP